MASSDMVEIVLALKNVSQFVSGAKEASGAIGQVGTASEESGKKATIGWKGLAKWAGGAAAMYAASRYVRSAVSATEDLAKSTLTLQRTTGMDTQTASEWVGVAKERGISTKQMQTSLVKLDRAMEASRTGTVKQAETIRGLRAQIDQVAAAGGKKAPAAIAKLSGAIAKAQGAGLKARAVFAQLGVPLSDIAKGNTEAVLGKVADALEKIRNPAQRAALMQTLFGRSGQALLPVLMKGSKGVQELLDKQKAYGNYLSGKNINDTKKLIAQQRELETAMRGVKTQLGVALLPVLISVGKLLVTLARVMQPLTKNALLFKIAIAALAIAFIAYKVAMIAAAIATGIFDTAAAPVVLTVLAIAAGIAALIVIGYELYKHWGAIKQLAGTVWHAVLDALQAVWNWVKANWPLLLGILIGPFGLAVGLIIQHFGAVKKFVLGIIDAVRQAIQNLVGYVTGLPGKIGGALGNLPVVGGVAKSAFSLGGSVLGHLADGGVTTRAGNYLVGERGPELLALPGGSAVQPLPAGGRPLEITVPVMINERELGRSVARIGADRLARR